MGEESGGSLKKQGSPRFIHIFGKPFTEAEIVQIADEMYEWFREPDNLWLKDFCISRMFATKKISDFAKRSDYFRQMLGLCKDIQESRLVKLGMTMKNPAMVVFALKNVAGWRNERDAGDDREEVEYDDQ